MDGPTKRPQRGTHYSGEIGYNGPVIRISARCPCNRDDCLFYGRNQFPREPDMVCGECGCTLHPNSVQYRLAGETHTAHNLVCPWCAQTVGCLD